ncbi:MAG: hypothetical protein PVG75_00615 [Thioalkalispiraceae bacterium]
MKKFSDYAYAKLIDLYNNHSHEVGSQLKAMDPAKYKSLKSTDCITYALNVMSYAFEQTGNKEAAKKVWSLGQHGNELAAYLVNQHNWKGIYINPDVNHPKDRSDEHTYSNYLANRSCKYYKIPLSYKVVNYNTTSKLHPSFQKLNTHLGETKLNLTDVKSLSKVKFGFGISRGGKHTWLFSNGKVYEVHWDSIGAGLYESMHISKYPWLSGAIVVPPDQALLLSKSVMLKCG